MDEYENIRDRDSYLTADSLEENENPVSLWTNNFTPVVYM